MSPGDVPHAEGATLTVPFTRGGGQLLQGAHASPLTLFLPFFSLCLFCLSAGAACWAGSPTGMLWGNYGTRGCCSWDCRGGGCQSVQHLG